MALHEVIVVGVDFYRALDRGEFEVPLSKIRFKWASIRFKWAFVFSKARPFEWCVFQAEVAYRWPQRALYVHTKP